MASMSLWHTTALAPSAISASAAAGPPASVGWNGPNLLAFSPRRRAAVRRPFQRRRPDHDSAGPPANTNER